MISTSILKRKFKLPGQSQADNVNVFGVTVRPESSRSHLSLWQKHIGQGTKADASRYWWPPSRTKRRSGGRNAIKLPLSARRKRDACQTNPSLINTKDKRQRQEWVSNLVFYAQSTSTKDKNQTENGPWINKDSGGQTAYFLSSWHLKKNCTPPSLSLLAKGGTRLFPIFPVSHSFTSSMIAFVSIAFYRASKRLAKFGKYVG